MNDNWFLICDLPLLTYFFPLHRLRTSSYFEVKRYFHYFDDAYTFSVHTI